MGRWVPAHRHATPGNLYLSNVANIVTVLFNGTFGPNGVITAGISTPDGEWTDANKNLYVTNCNRGSSFDTRACGALLKMTSDEALRSTRRSRLGYSVDYRIDG